jgi:Secretion system C-terminal sorting domain
MKHFDSFFRFLITVLFFYSNMYGAVAQSLVSIPNPSSDYICSYSGAEDDIPFFFQNKILIRLRQVSTTHLVFAFYDGTSYTVINNPDNGHGCQGHPIVFNNNLYIKYKDVNNQNRLAKLNGNTWLLINNFDNGEGYEGEPIIFNDKLYFKYKTSRLDIRLVQFDGTTISMPLALQNVGVAFPKLTVYKNKLYFVDWSTYQVMQFDGTNAVLLNQYPGPQVVGLVESFLIFQDTLFIRGGRHLVKTEGTNCYTVDVANILPTYTLYHFQKEPITYNNKLLFIVQNSTGINWAQYQNGVVQLIPNPTTGLGVEHEFTSTAVFNNKLYFRYVDENAKWRLAQLDGTTISLINTSLGYANGLIAGNNFPTVFNNALYFWSAGAMNMNLAKYDGQQISIVQNSQQLLVMPSAPILFNGNLYVRVVNHLAKLEEDIVKNEDLQNKISIYPNPANDYLVIEHTGVQESSIKIVNILGQEMLSKKLQNTQNSIYIADFPTGTYIINMTIDKKNMSRKFVKQ